MESLRNIKDQRTKFGLRNLATITYEVSGNILMNSRAYKFYSVFNSLNFSQTLRFLEDSPCKTQTKENILGFLNAVKPFQLTKAECVMLVNEPPTTPLHIQLQIEDSEERLSEEAVNQIIEMAKEWLIPKPEEWTIYNIFTKSHQHSLILIERHFLYDNFLYFLKKTIYTIKR